MFGLTKKNPCTCTINEKNDYTSLYCGTCRTIGTFYGNMSRCFLNSDIVFLAGIVRDSADLENNDNIFCKGQCFTLPEKFDIPEYLEFAAYANVVLAQINFEDKVIDEAKIQYRILKWLHGRKLNKRKVDLADFNNLMNEQVRREKFSVADLKKTLSEKLYYYSEVTEQMMELVLDKFSFGNNRDLVTVFKKFCRLLYILDALEDFEEDFKNNRFNALAVSLETNRLNSLQVETVVSHLFDLSSDIVKSLSFILKDDQRLEFYKNKLDYNLGFRLKKYIGLPEDSVSSGKYKPSFSQKWQLAQSYANNKYTNCSPSFSVSAKLKVKAYSGLLMVLPSPLWASQNIQQADCCTIIAILLGGACLSSCCDESQSGSTISNDGYDGDGYDRNGYDRDGYNKDGFDRHGFNRSGISIDTGSKFDKDGFDMLGWNQKGKNKYTNTKFDTDGYDRDGFNRDGWSSKSINKHTGSIYNGDGYDRDGYDRNGYDRDGFNRDGWSPEGINKHTGSIYNGVGYDRHGYDRHGYDRHGYDKDGYDKDGYDKSAFNRLGINKYTRTVFNANGYDREGYDIDGYDRNGYDREGIHKLTRNKFDEPGYDQKGCEKEDYNKLNEYEKVGSEEEKCGRCGGLVKILNDESFLMAFAAQFRGRQPQGVPDGLYHYLECNKCGFSGLCETANGYMKLQEGRMWINGRKVRRITNGEIIDFSSYLDNMYED